MIKNKIALDIGHGIDTYPPDKGIGDFAEFNFNNAVVKLAKPLAELNGFEVFLPQPFDSKCIPLNSRISAIKANRCNLVISTHGNAGVKEAKGREVWYWLESVQSKRLANLWLKNTEGQKTVSRGSKISSYEKGKNFAILRDNHRNNIPSILGEYGFFTNDTERELMKTHEFQMECAIAIVKTACDYFGMDFILENVKVEVEDKSASSWAESPIKWGIYNKISDGTRPKDTATREEVITMIHNYHLFNSK